MFILTDGKNYVMENPYTIGDYLATTTPNQAKKFTYNQAKGLIKRKGKKLSWIKNYQMVDLGSGEPVKKSELYNKGNGGAYLGKNDIEFDEGILDKILEESNCILGLAGWDMNQLETYRNLLNAALSKFDSAESDIRHAMRKYREDNLGKKPQAHKMAKLGYLLDEMEDKHKRIKQCLNYIKVMQDAITFKYDIGKIKLELSKAKYSDYKGRTEYYQIALDILN